MENYNTYKDPRWEARAREQQVGSINAAVISDGKI